MSFLKFLNEVVIEEVIKEKKPVGGPKKAWSPADDFMGIRVWKDGSVYPSKLLVDTFDLEYRTAIINAGADGKARTLEFPDGTGNGLDVIDTRKWEQYKHNQHCILIGVTPKNQPKISLFGSTKYNEDGTPVSSVLNQGAATFGASTLLPLVSEIYNIVPSEEEGFIDLFVDTTVNLKVLSPSGNFFFPKLITKGADQGKSDYERRENVDIFGLIPASFMEQTETTAGELQDSPVTEEEANSVANAIEEVLDTDLANGVSSEEVETTTKKSKAKKD